MIMRSLIHLSGVSEAFTCHSPFLFSGPWQSVNNAVKCMSGHKFYLLVGLCVILSYGRFSKSIRPDEVGKKKCYFYPTMIFNHTVLVCGACKEGKLIALFNERIPKTPKTVKTSQMASTKPQGPDS